tara:strand:+ start:628 stop:1236 length:609 start_codon:yes stop_codon:yes gene_type:complete
VKPSKTSLIAHRVNTIAELRKLPKHYGAEIDIRAWQNRLVLHHDPFQEGESLEDYLAEYDHGLLVLNIKETGIEDKVLKVVREHGIDDYFLLDVEFPYLYKASQRGEQAMAVRYSEAEGLDTVKHLKGLVDWTWIDVNTQLPLDETSTEVLASFRNCLVSPDLWDRPEDIRIYRKRMKEVGFQPDAVVAKRGNLDAWSTLIS